MILITGYFFYRGQDFKFIRGTWPEDTATFDSKFYYSETSNDMEGQVDVSVPIQTRHEISLRYNLKDENSVKHGKAIVDYNSKPTLNGNYTFKTLIEYVNFQIIISINYIVL